LLTISENLSVIYKRKLSKKFVLSFNLVLRFVALKIFNI